ncbi:PASTA domain-containing protein [Actinoplanes solisilvae]|uniref:PASTA domain-containing protein n=1 Tax=Actinoplanes solisilvae TaxID=2486853 RepID=UPI000FD8F58B|nr:PASTA domain-containing protein [Actinoplanes solisilvae]
MSYPPPHQPQQPQPAWPSPAPKKRNKLPYVLGGVAVVVALCLGGTIIAAVSSDGDKESFAEGYAPGAAAAQAPAQPTTPATTAPTPTAVAAEPVKQTEPAAETTTQAASTIEVPDGVGMNYQSAQDLWRSAGLVVAPATDATGANRLPVLDANWVVLSQDLKAGSKVATGTPITATVKKYSDD